MNDMTFKLNRRALLLAGVFLIGTPLVGCSSTTTVPTWVAALQAIATEFNLVMPQLVTAGMSSDVAAKVQAIIAQIQQALTAINSASTQTQGQSVLTTVEGYINALTPLALPFVAAIPGGSVLGLIIAALPAIELAVNMVTSLLNPNALKVASSAPPLPANMTAKAGATFDGSKASSQAYMDWLVQLNGKAPTAK